MLYLNLSNTPQTVNEKLQTFDTSPNITQTVNEKLQTFDTSPNITQTVNEKLQTFDTSPNITQDIGQVKTINGVGELFQEQVQNQSIYTYAIIAGVAIVGIFLLYKKLSPKGGPSGDDSKGDATLITKELKDIKAYSSPGEDMNMTPRGFDSYIEVNNVIMSQHYLSDMRSLYELGLDIKDFGVIYDFKEALIKFLNGTQALEDAKNIFTFWQRLMLGSKFMSSKPEAELREFLNTSSLSDEEIHSFVVKLATILKNMSVYHIRSNILLQISFSSMHMMQNHGLYYDFPSDLF